MGRAAQCDRCKKCFVPQESDGFMITFINPSLYTKAMCSDECRATKTSLFPDKSYDYRVDLCPLCSSKFAKFIMGVNLTTIDGGVK